MPNSRIPRIIGRIVKAMAVLLVFSVCGVLLWRVFSSGDPATMSVLTVNEHTYAAYEEHGEELILQYQNQDTITRGEKNAGYFSVTQYVFIPQANQVQLVFRYNNSTIKNLARDYGLSEIPSKDETLFDVTIVTTKDLTPDNREDNYSEDGSTPDTLELKRYYPTAVCTTRDTTSLYTYYRYVFDGISVEDDIVGVFADVYYVEDIDYHENAYGTLCLYDDETKWIEQKLSGKDIEALKAYQREKT